MPYTFTTPAHTNECGEIPVFGSYDEMRNFLVVKAADIKSKAEANKAILPKLIADLKAGVKPRLRASRIAAIESFLEDKEERLEELRNFYRITKDEAQELGKQAVLIMEESSRRESIAEEKHP